MTLIHGMFMFGCAVSALAGPAEAHARLALGLAELRPYLIPDRSELPSLAAYFTLSHSATTRSGSSRCGRSS